MSFNIFRALREFGDLPRGNREEQKRFLREGGSISLQTAIALYRNRQRLYGGLFTDIFPLVRTLCEFGFQDNIWSHVRYEIDSPSKNRTALADGLSDAAFLFQVSSLEVIMTLVEAGKFLTISENLLYEARSWPLKDRISLVIRLRQSIVALHQETFIGKLAMNKLSEFAEQFEITIDNGICERVLSEYHTKLLNTGWRSLSGQIEMTRNDHPKYSVIPFDIKNHQDRIAEVVENFVKGKSWESSGASAAEVFNFCNEFMKPDTFKLFLESLKESLINKKLPPEFLEYMVKNNILTEEVNVTIWSGVAYPIGHAS